MSQGLQHGLASVGVAPSGSVIHLLPGWAAGLPIAIIAGPHPPLYLYRGGRLELVEADPPASAACETPRSRHA